MENVDIEDDDEAANDDLDVNDGELDHKSLQKKGRIKSLNVRCPLFIQGIIFCNHFALVQTRNFIYLTSEKINLSLSLIVFWIYPYPTKTN